GAVLAAVFLTASAFAQSAGVSFHGSAQAVLAVTHVDPAPLAGGLTEAKIEEDMIMGHASALGGRVALQTTLNFEGLTMPGGVLTLGAWGEGFIDRRHPHTYVHELIASWNVWRAGSGRDWMSLIAGKGFVPFGTEDPMNRPALVFPVNHHWSQLLERAVAGAGVRTGPVAVEAALV